jgi:phage terminase large subunit
MPSGDIRFIDFHETSGQSLAENIRIVQSKRYVYGEHFVPHDAKVHEMSTGLTRLEIAYDLGLNMTVVDRIGVQDGIDLVKSCLERSWFHEPLCKIGIDHIANYSREWNTSLGRPEERPRHDEHSHCADSLRYSILAYKKYFADTRKQVQEQSSMPAIFDTERFPLGRQLF